MNYVEKVWDTFIRAMKGDLQAQAEILYVDAMLNGDNRLIKEEKKMLNVDKYRKEIDQIIENGGAPRHMLLRMCLQKTNLESIGAAEVLDWLFSEYEPPLLQNGDELKPGDWIEVSDDCVTWYNHSFVCYYNARFFVVGDVMSKSFNENGTNITGWKYARLPEDGE